MDKFIIGKLTIWLRRKRPGTIVKMREFWMQYLHSLFGIMPLYATLSAKVTRANGDVEELGIISTHAVTDAFVEQLVDALQAPVASFSNYKWGDSGTGTIAEAADDTTLETPCGEARDAGTQIEGATADIYKSVATHTYAGNFTITEHGLFNAAAAGTLMDRSVFTAISVVNGDKVEFTYILTCNSGG